MSDEAKGNLIKCADCLHCKQFREVNEATGRYVLKVKCLKGHWKVGRKHGHCDLHRVIARQMSKCPDYVSMSENEVDRQQFLRTLAATLPTERIIYEADGQPADILEVQKWEAEE